MAFNPKRMRIQSAASLDVRGLDAYFSPHEAVWPLLDMEENMPPYIWEPAAGAGMIVRCMKQRGFRTLASDIADYGVRDLDIQTNVNYLEAVIPKGVRGIVTNPPYKDAIRFIQKAMNEVPYHAWLLRTNFLEAEGRYEFFKSNPPARVLISSRRLPMMHRLGYDGPKSTSNTCFAWFVWDDDAKVKRQFDWFDWKRHYEDLDLGY